MKFRVKTFFSLADSERRFNKLQSPVIHVVDTENPVNRRIINARVLNVERAVRWAGIISLKRIEKLFIDCWVLTCCRIVSLSRIARCWTEASRTKCCLGKCWFVRQLPSCSRSRLIQSIPTVHPSCWISQKAAEKKRNTKAISRTNNWGSSLSSSPFPWWTIPGVDLTKCRLGQFQCWIHLRVAQQRRPVRNKCNLQRRETSNWKSFSRYDSKPFTCIDKWSKLTFFSVCTACSRWQTFFLLFSHSPSILTYRERHDFHNCARPGLWGMREVRFQKVLVDGAGKGVQARRHRGEGGGEGTDNEEAWEAGNVAGHIHHVVGENLVVLLNVSVIHGIAFFSRVFGKYQKSIIDSAQLDDDVSDAKNPAGLDGITELWNGDETLDTFGRNADIRDPKRC